MVGYITLGDDSEDRVRYHEVDRCPVLLVHTLKQLGKMFGDWEKMRLMLYLFSVVVVVVMYTGSSLGIGMTQARKHERKRVLKPKSLHH